MEFGLLAGSEDDGYNRTDFEMSKISVMHDVFFYAPGYLTAVRHGL